MAKKLNYWLEKKGIFEKCACGEHDCLFNTGVEAMSPGSAGMTIQVLEEM